jgi:hypothetical protein
MHVVGGRAASIATFMKEISACIDISLSTRKNCGDAGEERIGQMILI